eukprot:TRINITY_DN56508_c0_g2_i1.p1 TRINITY_DN56508_c0_g2~~TRINITY_DN56508_c0_g2_i1.p1  ORF type:complete len:286 (-),score=78.05 TRINITY_DN56508_c0_g2_i1:290-1147(-)
MLGRPDRVKRRTETAQRAAAVAEHAKKLHEELIFFQQSRRGWVGEEMDETIQQLSGKCRSQLEALNAAHAELEPTSHQPSMSGGNTRVAILKSREKALKAELQQLQKGVSADEVEFAPKAVQSSTLEDVLRAVSELESTIEHVTAQTSADQKLAREESELLRERRQLNHALGQQLTIRSQEQQKQPTAGRAAVLEQAAMALQATNKNLMLQLSQFLDRYYPSGDEGRVKELLQDLMNRSVTQPQEPWLVLTEHNAGPESVELLLRSGVAVKDKQDTRRLRLVKFY